MPGNWKRFAAKSPGWRARLGAMADRRPSCNWATTAATSAAMPNADPIPTCKLLAPMTGSQRPAPTAYRKSPLPRHLVRRLLLFRENRAGDQARDGRLRRPRFAHLSLRRDHALPARRRQEHVSGRLPLSGPGRVSTTLLRRCRPAAIGAVTSSPCHPMPPRCARCGVPRRPRWQTIFPARPRSAAHTLSPTSHARPAAEPRAIVPAAAPLGCNRQSFRPLAPPRLQGC